MAGVSIQEAARALGVAQDTVKRRIRRGKLQAHQEPTPQGFRWAVELEKEAQAQLEAKNQQISELHRLMAQAALPPASR